MATLTAQQKKQRDEYKEQTAKIRAKAIALLKKPGIKGALKVLLKENVFPIKFDKAYLHNNGMQFNLEFISSGPSAYNPSTMFSVKYVRARKKIGDGWRKKLLEKFIYSKPRDSIERVLKMQHSRGDWELRRVLSNEAYNLILKMDGVKEWCDTALNGLLEIAHSDAPDKAHQSWDYAHAKEQFFQGAKRAFDTGADYATLEQWLQEITTENLLEK